LDLLLHRAERSAVLDGARAPRDDCRDERVLAVVAPGQHRSGAVLTAQNAWDAWGVALPAAAGDEAHPHQQLPEDEDAEKSAARARDGRGLDARRLECRLELSEREQRAAAAVPCRPDVVQSAERSYEVRALRALSTAWGAPRSAEPQVRMVQPKRQVPPAPRAERAEQQPRAESLPDAGAARQLRQAQLEQASARPRVFRQPVPPGARLARM